MCGEVTQKNNGNEEKTHVRMSACNAKNKNQRWDLDKLGQLKHTSSGLCLDTGLGTAGQEVEVATCDHARKQQIWSFDFYEEGRADWRPSKQ